MKAKGERVVIASVAELIERLEDIEGDMPVSALTTSQYEQVGWAARPLKSLIDQCRQEVALARANSPTMKHLAGKIPVSRAGVVRLRAMGLEPSEIARRLELPLLLIVRTLREPAPLAKCGPKSGPTRKAGS